MSNVFQFCGKSNRSIVRLDEMKKVTGMRLDYQDKKVTGMRLNETKSNRSIVRLDETKKVTEVDNYNSSKYDPIYCAGEVQTRDYGAIWTHSTSAIYTGGRDHNGWRWYRAGAALVASLKSRGCRAGCEFEIARN